METGGWRSQSRIVVATYVRACAREGVSGKNRMNAVTSNDVLARGKESLGKNRMNAVTTNDVLARGKESLGRTA